jgi:valyl-tRNA synthetase
MEKCRKDLEKSSARLADEGFASRAPAEVVEKERVFVKETADKIDKMKASLALLRG